MTDIHAHILPFVDDGSDSFEHSIEMLSDSSRMGVKRIICTPHYRRGFFAEDEQRIEEVFDELKALAKKQNIDVELYLGREFTVYDGLIEDLKEGKFDTVKRNKFVLLEFPYDTETDVEEICYNVKLLGFVPVIAHAERYSYFRTEECVQRAKDCGAVIQVNASTIIQKPFPKETKFVKRLLKKRLVDVVASDTHYARGNFFGEAYEKVRAKYKDYADLIFDINPTHIAKSTK